MPQDIPAGFEIEQHGPESQAPEQQAPANPVADTLTPTTAATPQDVPLPAGFERTDVPAQPQEQRTEPLSLDEFKSQLYKRLNDPKGGDENSILEWAASVGHRITPNKDWKTNWQMAQENRVKPGSTEYGRVAEGDGQHYFSADDVGAFLRGAGSVLTLNFGDEGTAAAKAALGGGKGRTYDERYRNLWELYNAQDNIDELANPVARAVGTGAGAAVSSLVPISAMRQGAGLGVNMLRGAGVGGVEGAIAGTGAGSPDARFENTGAGAGIGTLVGGAAPLAVRAAGALAAPVVDAFSSRFGRGGAINTLSRRMGVTPTRMAGRAAELRDAGIEPTVYDVIGEAGQDMVGSMARRPTAGRETMQNFGDQARVGLQDRVTRQASRITDDVRTPNQAVDEITAARNADMESAMGPLRPQPVPLNGDSPVWEILATGEGRSATRAAAQLERDPEVKRALLELGTPPRPAEGAAEIQAMHDQVRAMGLAPEAEARALAQLPQIPEVARPTMTVDMADKIARSLNDAAEVAGRQGRAGRARVLRSYGQEVRGAAADAVPAYREALDAYGAESRAANAVELGEETLARNTDEFVARAGRLDRTPNASGTSDADLARIGLRRAIERRAGEGPRGALDIAESLARAPEQRARVASVIGDTEANTLSRNMAAEVDVARSRIRNAPRTGSRTSINQGDDAFLEGLATAVAHPASWKAAVVTGLRGLSKAGISDRMAERIVDLATDARPGAVDAAIEQLTRSLNGNRRRAQRLVDGLRRYGIVTNTDRSHPGEE